MALGEALRAAESQAEVGAKKLADAQLAHEDNQSFPEGHLEGYAKQVANMEEALRAAEEIGREEAEKGAAAEQALQATEEKAQIEAEKANVMEWTLRAAKAEAESAAASLEAAETKA